MTETTSQQPEVRPLRLTRVGALAVLVFLVGGVIYLFARHSLQTNPEVEVMVPVREIRPFEVIVPGDLGVRRVPMDPGRSYVRERAQLENRYALTSLLPDRPIGPEAVGPLAPAGLSSAFVFTVEGGAGVSLAGQLGRGSYVDVLLPSAGRIGNVFVLDVRAIGADRWAVTMSVASPLTNEQAAMLAEGRASVVRRPVGG